MIFAPFLTLKKLPLILFKVAVICVLNSIAYTVFLFCLCKKTYDNIETFRIGETDIKCENNVSLLGINIDFMLKFDDHVTEICKKASNN